ncbi:hypothetical protein P9112_012600 [Eukaryota sp. TZLM1-RC]
MFTYILFLSLLCSFVTTSTRFVLSDSLYIEAELPGLHDDRIVHVVTGQVDENSHIDAILFYVSDRLRSGNMDMVDFRSSSYDHTLVFKHRVFYDIVSGPRIWQGPQGFHPIKSTGYSEVFDSITISSDRHRESCRSGGWSYGRWFYKDWADSQAFVATDINNNGKLDVVIVSATGSCDFDHCSNPYMGTVYCSRLGRNPHINVKAWILYDVQPDGSFTSMVEGDDVVFNTTSIGARQQRVGVTASVQASNECGSSHLLTIFHGQTMMKFCLSGDATLNAIQQGRVNVPSVSPYSTSTFLNLKGELHYLLVNRGGEWFLNNIDFSKTYDGTFQLDNAASIAVTGVDFDGDEVDDLIVVDCPSTGFRCRIRHGTLFSDDYVDYKLIDENFINELI